MQCLMGHALFRRQPTSHAPILPPSAQAAAASTTMAASLGNAGKAMAAVGEHMAPAKMQQQVQEFARADARTQAASDAVGDALDLALESDEEGQAQDLVQQLMDEVGLELAAAMRSPPGARVTAAPAVPTTAVTAAAEEDEDELMLRLAELKS